MDRYLWCLRVDIVWIRCLLALVGIRGITTPRSEIHYFLFDRYFRLSELHAARGALRRAQRLRRQAEYHLERSDVDPPPSPVALAVSIPKRPTLIWAVGGRARPSRRA